MSAYTQAITNEDGELLGYDYVYDNDGWGDGYDGYSDDDYHDYDEETQWVEDDDQEEWIDGHGNPTSPPEALDPR